MQIQIQIVNKENIFQFSRNPRLPVMVVRAMLAKIHLAFKLQVGASRNIPASIISTLAKLVLRFSRMES